MVANAEDRPTRRSGHDAEHKAPVEAPPEVLSHCGLEAEERGSHARVDRLRGSSGPGIVRRRMVSIQRNLDLWHSQVRNLAIERNL